MVLLFISSLERSGSTILDLSLSRYSNVISLGEVWRVIKPHGAGIESVLSRDCTCGKQVENCMLWSGVMHRLSAIDESAPLKERYEILLEHISQVYGDDVTVVDSSKSLQALKSVRELSGVDVKVLYTVRDVRGWMESIELADKRKKELSWGRIFEPDFKQFRLSYLRHNILRKIPLWLPHEWLLRNSRLKSGIRASGLESISISYEAFIFDTDAVLARIEKFASLTPVVEQPEQVPQGLHIVRGNRTAFTSKPASGMLYNVSWMRRWKWSAILAFLPWVSIRNKRDVYYFEG